MAEILSFRKLCYFCCRQKASNFAGLPVNAENFCFDGYRWAVSAVMTRMNLVPSGTAGKFTPALIPFWDLANHSTDGFSTDWANDKVECRAAHPCVPGQQIFLFYGQRPNSQFLLHNGFFYPENRHSVAFVRLGLSRTDTLMPLKLRKLADLGHPVVHPHCDLQVSRSPPIFDAAGLQFVRIFLATSEADLNDLETNVGRPAVLSFLQTRLKLLTMQATRSEAEVKKILDETKSQNVRNVLSLALEWRDIIQAAQLYADAELVECQKAK